MVMIRVALPKRALILAGFVIASIFIIRAEDAALAFPGRDWERAKPESRGYSTAKLEVLRAWLRTQKTSAMLVSVRGRVIFEYGDLSRASKVASVRKSILAMLYGNYYAAGKVNLDTKVE
jgi:hypothetical protein